MVVPPISHPKCWSFLVGKPMVVGYHHFRKPPYVNLKSVSCKFRVRFACHGLHVLVKQGLTWPVNNWSCCGEPSTRTLRRGFGGPSIYKHFYSNHLKSSISCNISHFWDMLLFKTLIYLYWVVVSNMFYFHPYLGKISILTNIFQMGWNHQPVILMWVVYIFWSGSSMGWWNLKVSSEVLPRRAAHLFQDGDGSVSREEFQRGLQFGSGIPRPSGVRSGSEWRGWPFPRKFAEIWRLQREN